MEDTDYIKKALLLHKSEHEAEEVFRRVMNLVPGHQVDFPGHVENMCVHVRTYMCVRVALRLGLRCRSVLRYTGISLITLGNIAGFKQRRVCDVRFVWRGSVM